MALARYNGRVTNEAGDLIMDPTVTVRQMHAGMPLVPLYADREGTSPLSNPVTFDDGKIAFHCAGGAYRITVTSTANPGFSDQIDYVAIGLAAETDLSIFTPRGEWSDVETYSLGDFVTHEGSAFASLQSGNVDQEPDADTPGDTEYWMRIPTVSSPGDNGWSPVFSIESDAARRVLQVVDWVGGDGTKPETGKYIGVSGLVETVGDAVDIRGPAGASGAGTGTVIGPDASVVGNLVVWDDTSGELIDDSGVALSDVLTSDDIGSTVQGYDATTLKSEAIGVTVQGYDADTLKSDVSATLSVGYKATPYSAGTKSSGTFTPDLAHGNVQTCVNGGAFTLAPPSDDGWFLIQMTNNASAGAMTTSGFTRTQGSITTVNGDDFFLFGYKVGTFSSLSVLRLQ